MIKKNIKNPIRNTVCKDSIEKRVFSFIFCLYLFNCQNASQCFQFLKCTYLQDCMPLYSYFNVVLLTSTLIP